MADVVISKKDELYIRIDGERSALAEIQEKFSFFVDGYQYMPRYKMGIFDGKFKLFNMKSRTIYIGLLFDVLRFCERQEITVELKKEGLRLLDFSSDLQEFRDSMNRISMIAPYDYQLEAFERAIKLNRSLILSPTGSGKSLIIYLLVSFLLRVTDQNILIIVPSISLTEQLLGNFKEYQVDTDVSRMCHLVYSGKEKIGFAHQSITIALWQSIYNLPVDFYSKYGSVIVDEAHQADAVCITKIISKCSHIPFRFGLTGTLDGTKTHEMCLRGMFGPLTRTSTTKTLMTDGILSELKIECLVIKYTDPECRMIKNLKYQDEIAYITSHQERTRILVDIAMSQPKNTLLLFNFVDTHGRVLFRLAEQRAKERGKQVYFIYGGTPVEERERIRALVELHDNIVIIASVGVFAVGINMKNLHCVIFGHPYKSRIRNLQSIGRGLRLSAGKDSCLLIDICDDLAYKSHQNTVLKHFLARLKIYESEHFKYQIKKITL